MRNVSCGPIHRRDTLQSLSPLSGRSTHQPGNALGVLNCGHGRGRRRRCAGFNLHTTHSAEVGFHLLGPFDRIVNCWFHFREDGRTQTSNGIGSFILALHATVARACIRFVVFWWGTRIIGLCCSTRAQATAGTHRRLSFWTTNWLSKFERFWRLTTGWSRVVCWRWSVSLDWYRVVAYCSLRAQNARRATDTTTCASATASSTTSFAADGRRFFSNRRRSCIK